MRSPDPDALLRQFRRRDLDSHRDAGEAILALGTDGIPLLLRCLSGGDEGSRQRAAELVVRCGPAALPGLTELAELSGPGARARIAWILGNVEGREPASLLTTLAADANASVRRQAIDAAGRHYERDPLDEAALALAQGGLKDPETSIRVRALEILSAKRDVRVVPNLIEALSDSHPSIRHTAALALGHRGDARAVPALVKGLTDHAASVRQASAQSLGRLGGSAAIGPLVTAVKTPDLSLAFQAAEALGNIGPLAAPALTELLKHDDKLVRTLTIGALRRMGARAVPSLCQALRDAEAPVRVSAAEALQHMAVRDPGPELLEAVPLLRRLLSPWAREIPPNAKVYRTTLVMIEEATAAMQKLPLPATAPPRAGSDLPRPAEGAAPDAAQLPRPSGDAEVDAASHRYSAGAGDPERGLRQWARLSYSISRILTSVRGILARREEHR